jgi:hypothetical protein
MSFNDSHCAAHQRTGIAPTLCRTPPHKTQKQLMERIRPGRPSDL